MRKAVDIDACELPHRRQLLCGDSLLLLAGDPMAEPYLTPVWLEQAASGGARHRLLGWQAAGEPGRVSARRPGYRSLRSALCPGWRRRGSTEFLRPGQFQRECQFLLRAHGIAE